MVDTFHTPGVKAVAHSGVTYWDLCDELGAFTEGLLRTLSGELAKYQCTAWDSHGSTVTRPSVRELQQACHELRMPVKFIQVELMYVPFDAHWWESNVSVKITGHPRTAGHSPERAEVQVSGTQKIQVDGVLAQIAREVDEVNRLAYHARAREEALVAEQLNLELTAVSSTAVSRPEALRKWIARTWREHTAEFAIALGTTVLGGALLAWLGLTR